MSCIDCIIHDYWAELRLNNPAKLNALTPSMLNDLQAHCARVEALPAVRAVCVTAAPARAFCVGADINAWSSLSPMDFAREWVRNGHRIIDALATLSKPTVAAISGHAFGGGLELAAACDVRIIHPDALLALPEPSIGVVPGWSGTQRLTRLLPEPLLKEMALFGSRLTAARAYQSGFVAAISDNLQQTATDLIEQLLGSSAAAIEVTKYMIHATVGEHRPAMIEALGSGMISAHSDKTEGVAAFRDKRKPVFA